MRYTTTCGCRADTPELESRRLQALLGPAMKLLVGMLYTLLPELVLFTAAALLAASTFSGAGQLAAELGAAAILVTALGLSAQFNRSRMFFALLALLSAY